MDGGKIPDIQTAALATYQKHMSGIQRLETFSKKPNEAELVAAMNHVRRANGEALVEWYKPEQLSQALIPLGVAAGKPVDEVRSEVVDKAIQLFENNLSQTRNPRLAIYLMTRFEFILRSTCYDAGTSKYIDRNRINGIIDRLVEKAKASGDKRSVQFIESEIRAPLLAQLDLIDSISQRQGNY